MEEKNINLENYNLLTLTLEIISKLNNEGLVVVQENIKELLKVRTLSPEEKKSLTQASTRENHGSKDQFYTDINAESFSAAELTNIGERITRSKNGHNLTQEELDNRVAKYLNDKRGE